MTFGSIYKIQFPNGKHYIGQTTCSLKKRQKEHKSCAKSDNTKVLYKALRKYNMVDTFELIEIDTADSLEELCEKEIVYILNYNSHYIYGNGYNMTYGGEGANGYVPTEEDNIKNSERRKKYYEDNPEARKQHGEKMKKYYEDNPEAIQKNSEALKKYFEDNPKARKQHGERMKQYYEDNPEARQQMSEIKKKYYEDNPEAKDKMSEISKKQWESPEARQQMSEIKKTFYKNNPQARQKGLDAIGKNKPFDAFKGEQFIKTFTYHYEAKEYLKKEYNITSKISVGLVLNGKRKSSAGFVFKYK
jgi:hypothetical protein